MSVQSNKTKQIAKNTMFLYMRMLFLMLISLYTSRVVLKAIGVEDFGIYNIVGGVVAMFAVISGSLSASISRFLNFEMGRGDSSRLKHIFSSSITIQIIVSIIIVLLAETLGLWFLNNKIVIPMHRSSASIWVYQFSVLTFVINLISIPYNAAIIAHEKMSAFAYIGILEGLLKLVIAYLITLTSFDRLVLYAALMSAIAFLIRCIYSIYCSRHFDECKYSFCFDQVLLKEMFVFAGWNYIGAIAGILRDQGGNIILNWFCGPVVNAARGISTQVNNAISGFVRNFTIAVNPQITQSFSNGNRTYMQILMYQGAKLSYFVLLLLSLPIIVNTPYLLGVWLGEYPDYSIIFVRLTLILSMWESIASPMSTGLLATGNIKMYQLFVGGLNLLNIPVSYFLLLKGFPPETVLVVAIFISQFTLFMRLYFVKVLLSFDVTLFVFQVYLRLIVVSCISFAFTFSLYNVLEESFMSFLYVSLFSIICTLTNIYFIGCNLEERILLKSVVKKFIHKFLNR